jgi:hypothetical protein
MKALDEMARHYNGCILFASKLSLQAFLDRVQLKNAQEMLDASCMLNVTTRGWKNDKDKYEDRTEMGRHCSVCASL